MKGNGMNSVLLFSGGLDSVCFEKLLNPNVLLYVPMGADYEAVETERLYNLVAKGYISRDRLVILPGVLNFKNFLLPDATMPNRNAHLILLASVYGESIILGSVRGDRLKDKDRTFFSHMETVLNHMWQKQSWTEERRFRVSSPFKETTKVQLVADFILAGGHPNALLESYSCHRGTSQPCGVCVPCARKHVALANNGLAIPPNYFESPNFWEADWFKKAWPDIKENRHREGEDLDFIRFFDDRKMQP